ncbi:MAG: DEAD/DEAH box helicase [Candidatus Kerfeldbacteria bacterium]|nr:DEAD/DEAH box helicase [Candidatus Kerfeldbacteria bacterium]
MHTIPFSELPLSKELQKAISEMGFEEASPIQTQTIPLLLEGSDIIGQAQTGTGKTAAFAIPVIEKIDLAQKAIQAVILCPTRELAIQVSEEFQKLLKYTRGVFVVPIYGGQPIQRQMQSLRQKPQIIIATPGRMMDHIERKSISLGDVKIIVLDEADEMLNMGFRESIEEILNYTPEERQTVLFSATMPRAIAALTKKYQRHPKHIQVAHKKVSAPKIEQFRIEVRPQMKLEVLSRLIDVYNVKSGVVFCNTKRQVDEVVTHLKARGYSAQSIHGDLRQTERDRVMKAFKNKKVDLLVATDVAARGIDVEDLEAVFNYDVPQDEEYYVHRIGRTGRAGKSGRAFTFASGKQSYLLRQIQRYTQADIKPHPIPSLNDIEEIKFVAQTEKIKETLLSGKLQTQIERVEKLMKEGEFTSMDIAAALLKMLTATPEVPEIEMPMYENRRDGGRGYGRDDRRGERGRGRNPGNRRDYRSYDREPGEEEPGMARLRLDAGRADGIRPGDVVGAIAGESGIAGNMIGAITIQDKQTFVDVPEDTAGKVMTAMKGKFIRGKRTTLTRANAK